VDFLQATLDILLDLGRCLRMAQRVATLWSAGASDWS